MKKIVIILILFCLTGCVSSGELTNTCKKIESSKELTSTTTYTINFKNDEISNINIINEYVADASTISAIKLSTTTQNNFWKNKVTFNTLVDDKSNYKTEYIIEVKTVDDSVYNYFNLKKERSKLVNYLKENGFECN